MREVVERQPGAVRTGTSATATQYSVPSRSRTVAVPRGTPAPVARRGPRPVRPPVLADRRPRRRSGPVRRRMGTETITLTLAAAVRVTRRAPDPGRPVEFPRLLRVETSLDGRLDAVAAGRRRARVHSRGAWRLPRCRSWRWPSSPTRPDSSGCARWATTPWRPGRCARWRCSPSSSVKPLKSGVTSPYIRLPCCPPSGPRLHTTSHSTRC